MTERQSKRKFADEFKPQMGELYNSGKSWAEIIKECDLTPSLFDKWVTRRLDAIKNILRSVYIGNTYYRCSLLLGCR